VAVTVVVAAGCGDGVGAAGAAGAGGAGSDWTCTVIDCVPCGAGAELCGGAGAWAGGAAVVEDGAGCAGCVCVVSELVVAPDPAVEPEPADVSAVDESDGVDDEVPVVAPALDEPVSPLDVVAPADESVGVAAVEPLSAAVLPEFDADVSDVPDVPVDPEVSVVPDEAVASLAVGCEVVADASVVVGVESSANAGAAHSTKSANAAALPAMSGRLNRLVLRPPRRTLHPRSRLDRRPSSFPRPSLPPRRVLDKPKGAGPKT
jgi:hypothetical protein